MTRCRKWKKRKVTLSTLKKRKLKTIITKVLRNNDLQVYDNNYDNYSVKESVSYLVILFFLLLLLVVKCVHRFIIIFGFFLLRLYFLLQNVKSKSTINILKHLLSRQRQFLALNLGENLSYFFFLLVDHITNNLFTTTTSQMRHIHFKSYN